MTNSATPSSSESASSSRPVLSQRRRLPHEIPGWVGQGARHFITINALERGTAPFTSTGLAPVLLENLLTYERLGKWYLWLAVIMPDHLHFIATFNLNYGIEPTLTMWRGYQKRTLKIKFQSGFFEHRLRNEEEFALKMDYVRNNPVRKQLVTDAADWPHIYQRHA